MGQIAEMMGGLPMNELIGAPLTSVVSAQRDLAHVMIAYINDVGYAEEGSSDARMLNFNLTKPVIKDDTVEMNQMRIQAPLLGLLPLPALLDDFVGVLGKRAELVRQGPELGVFSSGGQLSQLFQSEAHLGDQRVLIRRGDGNGNYVLQGEPSS